MTTKSKLFIDVHAIQTLPPSNINRDDTGSPKTAQYGGARRTRVSSQSWKRAMRNYFKEVKKENVGYRTAKLREIIVKNIISLEPNIDYASAYELTETQLDNIVKKVGSNEKKVFDFKEGELTALYFVSPAQVKALAEWFIKVYNKEIKASKKSELSKIYKEELNKNMSIDIALFGRMLATDASLNEDASSQVAHAISTHAVQTEFDFFTGIDDLSPEDNAGAGMLGTVEFNSSTLYRYANVAAHDLFRQLADKEATIKTLKLFIEAFAKSLPTGKVNTFANQTLPQALVVSVRSDRPINLVSAFEKPVKPNDGYVVPSIEKLSAEFGKISKFSDDALYTVYVTTEEVEQLQKIGIEQQSLNELLSNLESKLNEFMDTVGE
ncbi:type I-E CRISPR-associated protein Cas7/Cse4/CasC [Aerococcaceae bacterium NML201209]|nr:type I-E CRISPR-associated protein Cas7/Cse4/CasC [Aerococcaceae bacterium NML201209]MCW6664934.1 type I-E CRISPR-associated protein Cas7/Cse4/CasC [Aerococcaceae bacterium NML191219]